jgi:septum formation inhibitor MinC
MSDDDAKIAWQVLRAELVEVIRGKHWAPKDGVEETSFRAFLRL